jgi:hypothetical protein
MHDLRSQDKPPHLSKKGQAAAQRLDLRSLIAWYWISGKNLALV